MHSPDRDVAGDGVAAFGARRATGERVLRLTLFVLVLVAVWRLWRASDDGMDAGHVVFAGSPSTVARDSLAAHVNAGDSITWSGSVTSLATMSERVREPGDLWRVSVSGNAAVSIADELGAVDSLEDSPDERALTMTAARGALTVVEGETRAATAPSEAFTLGRVAVFGHAGWEAKFVIAALEEAGWSVDARLTLGRDREVVQGDPHPRLERHAAVIVLDTAVGIQAAELARYVRGGGGLVLAGVGARTSARAVTDIAPARVTSALPALAREFEGGDPTRSLPLHALGAVRPDAVILSRRDSAATVVARRAGGGRVAQVGFGETWRWRMQGEGRGVSEHRAFWSSIVGGVAAVSQVSDDGAATADEGAPLARLTQALGPAAPDTAPASPAGPPLPPWLGLAILGVALVEWASRRSRGAV